MNDNDWPAQFRDRSSHWCWWWRHKNDNWEYDPESRTIKILTVGNNEGNATDVALVAWQYELARRHDRKIDLPPFPDAEESLWKGVEDLAGLTKVWRCNDTPLSEDLDVWDDHNWSCVMNIQWNLSASDKELAKAFLRFIDDERRNRGISRPKKKGPHGKRNRRPSWRWPEILDQAYHGTTLPTNDADRSILSRAKKAAKLCYFRLADYLKE